MGDRLVSYYEYVSEVGGIAAKIKLATLTKIPSTRAGAAPDSPENLARFREAVEKITGKSAPDL